MTATSTNLLRHVRQLAATRAFEQWTDQQLLERFAAVRDEAMFGLLVRRHGPMVLGVCRRLLGHEQDAEDAFQAAFLLLARKADHIRQADVGGWLYRVAYHVAIRARAQSVKRQRREKRSEAVATGDPSMEPARKELLQVVDEELQRLPEDARSALVLCHLEGKTQEEAAQLLGCSKGTLRRRLDRGRELLRTRLMRRGLAPLAALTASLFTESLAPAVVPAALARATVRGIGSGTESLAVLALAEAGLSLMSVSKAKATTAILLLASLLGGAGVWACRGLSAATAALSAQVPAAKADDKPPKPAAKQEKPKTAELQGQVLDPDGKPKAGAKLLLLGRPQSLGTSGADGSFRIALPKETKGGTLIAQAQGFGIDFMDLPHSDPKMSIELRLVKDRPIRGRIVTTEGKPAAGVRLAVTSLGVYPDNSMDSFLIAWKKRHFMSGIPGGVKSIWSGLDKMFAATTDAEGRFVLHGLGEERLVALRLSGAGLAEDELWIVSRGGFDPAPYNQATLDNIPKGQESLGTRWMLHGPDLDVVAEAEKVLRGIVKDTESGKGRTGVLVQLTRRDGGDLLRVMPQARTDAQGRYELHGARKSKRYMLEISGDPDAGYMPSQVWVDDSAGYQPITADIPVKKGVIVTGKMLDGTTGKPVHGRVMIAVLNNNPFVKDYPAFGGSAWFPMRDTDADGSFRVVAIPGHVLLMGGPDDGSKYKAPKADPKYPQYFDNRFSDFPAYYGSGGGMSLVQGCWCKVLDIKKDAKTVEQNIILEHAAFVPVRIQDAEGKPLTDVWIGGTTSQDWYPAIQCKEAECKANQIDPAKPRVMVFYHERRKLVGTLTLKGDEKAPVVAKLGPTGAIKGQLLDADGNPLASVAVEVFYKQRVASEVHHVIHHAKQIVTDANGIFTLDDLIPQQKFELSFGQGKRKFERAPKLANPAIEVKAGENRDLGAIKLKRIVGQQGD